MNFVRYIFGLKQQKRVPTDENVRTLAMAHMEGHVYPSAESLMAILMNEGFETSLDHVRTVLGPLTSKGASPSIIIDISEQVDKDGWPDNVVEALRNRGFDCSRESVEHCLVKERGFAPKRSRDSGELGAHEVDYGAQPLQKRSKTLNICDLDEIVSTIKNALRKGPSDDIIAGNLHLVVIGLTGSGKSTLVNSLAGCDIRSLTFEEADMRELPRNSLCVQSVAEGGSMDAVSAIGEDMMESCTNICHSVHIEGRGLVLWDVPGFDDTHGPALNISNAINLSKLLKISQKYGLQILLTIDVQSFETCRGKSLKGVIDVLLKLFQCESAPQNLEKHLQGIIFCLTKASPEKHSLRTLKKRVLEASSNHAALDLSSFEQNIVLYDPLFRHSEALSRGRLLELILSMRPIAKDVDLFRPSLSIEDRDYVNRITQGSSQRIRRFLSQEIPEFDKICEYVEVFDSLVSIIHEIEEVQAERKRICDIILEVLRTWELKVHELKSVFDAESRKMLKVYLQNMERASIFNKIVGDQASPDKYETLYKLVELSERIEQEKIRSAHEKDFQVLLDVRSRPDIQCNGFLDELPMSITEVELGLDKLIIRDTTMFPGFVLQTLTRRLSSWDLAKDLDLLEKTNILDFLKRVRESVALVTSEDIFLCKDQLGFCDLALDFEKRIMWRTFEILLENVVPLLCKSLESEGNHLIEQQGWTMVEAEGEYLRTRVIKVQDIQDLVSFGFRSDITEKLLQIVQNLHSFPQNDFKDRLIGMLEASFEELFRSAKHYYDKSKIDVKEQTTWIISDILACPELRHFEKRKEELNSALLKFKALEGATGESYVRFSLDVRRRLDSFQSEGEVSILIQAASWTNLINRFEILRELRETFLHHFDLDVSNIETAVWEEIQKLINSALSEINRDVDNKDYLEFKHIRTFRSVYEKVSTAFPSVQESLTKLQVSAKEALETVLLRTQGLIVLLDAGDLRAPEIESITRLLIKSCGVSFELEIHEEFKSSLRIKLLETMKDSHKVVIGEMLLESSTDCRASEGVSEMARTIIDTFPEFKSFNIEIFNKKAGSVTFEASLRRMGESDLKSLNLGVDSLNGAYKQYQLIYQEQVNKILQNFHRFQEKDLIDQIDKVGKQLTPFRTQLGCKLIEFGEYLGYICSLWTYLSAKMHTLGSICDEKKLKFLQQPHATQILGIFRLLALDQKELANHLIQINTGEGKSIALGFTAAVLAKLGFQVNVVCYNRYLSERDFSAFQPLFDCLGLDNIMYSDFDGLASKLLESDSCFPDVRKWFLYYLQKNVSHKRSKSSSRDQTILLLDEVDIFFSEHFYARPHSASLGIGGEDAFSIIYFVWENRERLGMDSSFVDELMKLKHTAALQKKFPHLDDKILEQEFKKIVLCARCFPRGQIPKLSGGSRLHVLDEKEHRIGYEDPVSGVPDFSASYSYYTAFTYLYYCEQQKLPLEKVRSKLQIQPICGSILYSEFPKYFDFCLGMTGTLDCITEKQEELLSKYNFERKTFLPSTFEKQSLNCGLSLEETRTVVVRGTMDEYFEEIIKDVSKEFDKGRAILIIFADYARLRWFKDQIKFRNLKHPRYVPPLELLDSMDEKKRQYVITRAIRSYTITLMTRAYGRGTDFICRDGDLKKNGGVHVITTFFPEHESENKQIHGRTCRQDDPGSARKVIFEDDLKFLEASNREFYSLGLEDWDTYLQGKRTKLEEKVYESMMKTYMTNLTKHTLTADTCQAVKREDWDAAKQGFLQLNNDLKETGPAAQKDFHVILVLDGSGSMQGNGWNSLIEAVGTFLIRRLNENAKDLVTIILFSSSANIVCERMPLFECSPRHRELLRFPGGGTNFSPALNEALNVLRRSNQGDDPSRTPLSNLLLFMSDGQPDSDSSGTTEMRMIAREFGSQGILVNTLAFGSARIDCLQELATIGGGKYLEAVNGIALRQCFEEVAATLSHHL